MLMILLFPQKFDQASDLRQQLKLASELEFDLGETADVDFNAGIKLRLFILDGLVTQVLLMTKWKCLFLKKISLSGWDYLSLHNFVVTLSFS